MKLKTIVVIILLNIICYSINQNVLLVNARFENNRTTIVTLDGLVQHPPIRIISDENLSAYHFPGLGTEKHPYHIRNLNITTNERTGIYISKTSKYIVIENCYIDALNYGIEIVEVADDTLLITKNLCKGNRYYGTFLWKTSSSIISYNYFINNADGLTMFYSHNAVIINNTCVNNSNYGIYTSRSENCSITKNVLKTSYSYGVVLGRYTVMNAVHHNYFIDNNLNGSSQAYDHGSNNIFYDLEAKEGNWWNDWTGGYYDIEGNTFAVDIYPLGEPIEDQIRKASFELFSLFVLLPAIAVLYSLKRKSKKQIN